MLKRLLENFIIKATDWWFRVTTIERFLLQASFGVIVIIYASPPLIEVVLRLALNTVPEGFLSFQHRLDTVDGWILGICSLVILVALAISIVRFIGETRTRSRRRVIVVEGRGLRDDDGTPLVDAVSGELGGQLVPLLLDLRNSLDGHVIQPERAVENIDTLHRSVHQHRAGIDRLDFTLVYGGLTPVPYTFLTGVLMDDEGVIKVYDWDRAREAWRDLSGEDDGSLFELEGMNDVSGVTESVLALAFSYPISDSDIATAFSYPVVKLTLKGMSADAHWSSKKQSRLSQEFLEVAKRMSANGVNRIHLIFAAPNSVVFNFGRRYDTRNLPEIVVYQYQRGKNPAYPWGVLMPVAGIEKAHVIYVSVGD